MEKALFEAWWAQLGIGGMGFLTLIYFLLKSGKFSVSLIAPTAEKKANVALEVAMKTNVGLMEKNLTAFGTVITELAEIRHVLQETKTLTADLANTQREVRGDLRVHNEVMKMLRRE